MTSPMPPRETPLNLQVLLTPPGQLSGDGQLRELMLERRRHLDRSSGCHRVEELILQPLAFNGGIGFLGRPDRQWWLAVDDFRDGLKLLRSRVAPDDERPLGVF